MGYGVATVLFHDTRARVSDEVWLSTDDAAKYLGMSRTSLWRLGDKVPHVRTQGGGSRTGRRRYRRADLDEYLGRPPAPTTGLEERVASLEAWRARHEAEHR